MERLKEWIIGSESIKENFHEAIHWFPTHSYICSSIFPFNKCTLMKTATNADGYPIQPKVMNWTHSWLFLLTVSSMWRSEVIRKLSWMDFCQEGRIIAERKVVEIFKGGKLLAPNFIKHRFETCVKYFLKTFLIMK